jgi:DsbC/DsbD-like thiol-disulfide interchange protein
MSVGIMNRAAKSRVLSFVVLLVFLPGAVAIASAAAPPAAKHARVDLIAEQSTVVPGKRFWIGLRFQLDPGWHIYWKNPGDSGTPPRAQWNLPPGFSAGGLLWPAPVRLGKAPIVDYGYEGQVLLMLPVRPPAALKPGSTVTLGATVKWVVCRDICIADEAVVKLALPIAENSREEMSPWHALFAATRARLPRPAPRAWRIRALAGKGQFTLLLETGVRPRQATFFPLEEGQIDNAAPQEVAPLPRGVKITLKQSDQRLKPISVLRGVLVLSDGRAYEIAAPVSPGR